jgi:hypothetical protein
MICQGCFELAASVHILSRTDLGREEFHFCESCSDHWDQDRKIGLVSKSLIFVGEIDQKWSCVRTDPSALPQEYFILTEKIPASCRKKGVGFRVSGTEEELNDLFKTEPI